MVEHGAMLTGVNHRRLEFLRSLAQGVNHERQLDGFRSRTENRDDPTFMLRIACRFYWPRFTIPASRNLFRRGFRGQDCSPLMNFSSCIAYAVLGKITKGAEALAGQ
jgi:hypothetical protein